jgi:hypothetical protein
VSRIFLLSPATSTGKRAELLLSPRAQFALAAHVRSPEGAPLGEVFAFLSGLYFRGKLAYARAFARPPRRLRNSAAPNSSGQADNVGPTGVLVITPSLGLQLPEYPVTADVLDQFARVRIETANPAYREPLAAAARLVAELSGPRTEVVLLGSIATGKYVDVLLDIFGDRLLFPAEFVGRGDMSRGGLMLRCAQAGQELSYVPVKDAVRHGPRPPRLEPLRRTR